MKAFLSERNLVIVLFVMVFVIFSLAHEDSKKMEEGYKNINTYTATKFASIRQQDLKVFPANAAEIAMTDRSK
jgi:hypothetical protein